LKNNKLTTLIIVFLLIIILMTVFQFITKYSRLKKLNDPLLNQQEIEDYYKEKWESFVEDENRNVTELMHYVSVNDAIDGDYKILSVLSLNLSNVIKTNYFSLVHNADNVTKIDNYMSSLNLTREDNVVLLCHWGSTAKTVSIILNLYGYNTSYTSVYTKEETELEYTNKLNYAFNVDGNNDILIDELKFHKKTDYIFFVFDKHDQYILLNHDLIDTTKDKIIAVTYNNVMPFMSEDYEFSSSHILPYNNVNFNDAKVICYLPIHCFLTRQLLNYYDIDVLKIHKTYESPGFESYDITENPIIMDKLYIAKWSERNT